MAGPLEDAVARADLWKRMAQCVLSAAVNDRHMSLALPHPVPRITPGTLPSGPLCLYGAWRRLWTNQGSQMCL